MLDRGVHIDPDCALDIFERLGAQRARARALGHACNLRLGLPASCRAAGSQQIAAARGVERVRVLAPRREPRADSAAATHRRMTVYITSWKRRQPMTPMTPITMPIT